MKESSIERRFVAGVKRAGGLALKFVSPGHSGVPDRLVLLPGGRIVFVELKTETGTLSPLQIETHNQLRKLGCEVRTLYGKSYVEGFLEEIKGRESYPVNGTHYGGYVVMDTPPDSVYPRVHPVYGGPRGGGRTITAGALKDYIRRRAANLQQHTGRTVEFRSYRDLLLAEERRPLREGGDV